jgi:DNA-binding YbaB/EbfC family protein
MFKGLSNLASLMKQAQEMQSKVGELQESLKRVKVQGSAGGGLVTIEATAQPQFVSCRIDPSLIESGDQEMIEDLVVTAMNQALDKAKQAAADEMQKLTAGMDLGGMREALSKMGMVQP